jgi:DNA-binding SARP family transcriptional activator
MLKALIALGGEEVTEEALTDLLWPESEGDAAASAFSTTLQRVRNIVGQEKAIQLREGRLSLDPRYCWTDVRAFERMAEQAEAAWKTPGSSDEALSLSRRTAELYKGHFLPAEDGLAWTVSYRERFKSKFFRVIMKMGNHLEKAREWDEAIANYERALEIDDLAESVYCRIMLCYQRLGRIAEAVSVYQRCRAVLAATIGINPSEETEALYSSLRSR